MLTRQILILVFGICSIGLLPERASAGDELTHCVYSGNCSRSIRFVKAYQSAEAAFDDVSQWKSRPRHIYVYHGKTQFPGGGKQLLHENFPKADIYPRLRIRLEPDDRPELTRYLKHLRERGPGAGVHLTFFEERTKASP